MEIKVPPINGEYEKFILAKAVTITATDMDVAGIHLVLVTPVTMDTRVRMMEDTTL